MCAMTVKYSSERTIEAIIESVIIRSLADQSEQHTLDRGQRKDPEDNEGNICSDGQLFELSREIFSLLSEVEAMDARLRLSAPARSTSRRSREPFASSVWWGQASACTPPTWGGARMTSTRAVTSTQAGGGGVPLALLLCTELLLDAA